MKRLPILFLCLLAALVSAAQSGAGGVEPHRFAEPTWEELTRDLDYSPFGEAEKKEERDRSSLASQRESGERRRNPAVSKDHPLLANIVKFGIILAAAVALAILLKHLLGFGGGPRNKKIHVQELDEARLEDIEENLHESELEGFIRQAIERGQYTLAIRLYFLAILKELSLRESIRWRKNKTNRAYLNELSNDPDYNDFRKTARIFERIWYGDRTIDARAFQRIEGDFANFLRRLQEANQSNSTFKRNAQSAPVS